MMDYAKIEGEEIVIRLPISALSNAVELLDIGCRVTDPAVFAREMVRGLNAEDMGEDSVLAVFLDRVAEDVIDQGAEGISEN